MPEEILTPGEGQIRALIVQGGNPALCIPNQTKVVEALNALELLVVIDPYMSATAQLADYVLAPTMMYERPDLPISVPGFSIGTSSWAQYTPAVIDVPENSDLVEDWYPYLALAKHLGVKLEFFGVELDLGRATPPTTDEMLEIRLAQSLLTLPELKEALNEFPGGHIYDPPSSVVQPARLGATARFDVMPHDVTDELHAFRNSDLATEGGISGYSHLMIPRRMNAVMNTVGINLASTLRREPTNSAYLHPDKLSKLGVLPGDRIEIASQLGQIEAVAQADTALRPGVVSIAHCWGGLGRDGNAGVNINLLIPHDKDTQPINQMPRMSAVPVNISRVLESAGTA